MVIFIAQKLILCLGFGEAIQSSLYNSTVASDLHWTTDALQNKALP